MEYNKFTTNNFISSKEDAQYDDYNLLKENTNFKLAFLDREFMLRPELRAVRLQLELLKPEIVQQEEGIDKTVVIFGSARIADKQDVQKKLTDLQEQLKQSPDNSDLQFDIKRTEAILGKSQYYDYARELSKKISSYKDKSGRGVYVITGGGPGIMEGANRGAHDVGAKSIGAGIVLPKEERPNQYITPELSFKFHYFSLRKMHFLLRAQALVAFPGGFGTLDELFEVLTLIQTKKVTAMPLILFGESYWKNIINFNALVDEGMICPKDLKLINYVNKTDEAWDLIKNHLDII